ncbi:MAG: hypothetical protein MUF69_12895 [Desulfobacterota bacterium]|nr:hypothetical protein [Thermodesulfobacteriota bacterium]
MSHDDGDTAMEIGSCLPVIVKALDQSSLNALDRLSWALEAVLRDEYSLLESLVEYLHRKHPEAAWSSLADRILERLGRFKPFPDKSSDLSKLRAGSNQ